MDIKKPLSPHLQIYRLPLTAILSISHRLSGVILGFVYISFVFILLVLAFNVEMFNILLAYFNNFIGKIIVALASLTIFYHMTNGVRHMVWDLGYGFEIQTTKITGLSVIFGSVILTIIFYFIGKNFI